MKRELHTPDGVRDIYNGECKTKLVIEEKLHKSLLSFGYQDIQTPSFEFFDIFGREIGTTPSKDLYKFFDKEGNTLVLRPDFTPSIARSAAKYYDEIDMPIKLCYLGSTFVNYTDYKGRLKESTQCGAELMGDASIYADAEILAMVVAALQSVSLHDFQISVGHAKFFQGLISAAEIGEEEQKELKELLSNKNFFGVEEYVETLSIPEDLKKLFGFLGMFDAKEADLKEALTYANAYPMIHEAIDNLLALLEQLKVYGIEKYVSFELGIVSEYQYYTGIIFSAYTFGTGEAIVKGGRYNDLLSYFGKNKPAIGFAILVDQLMAALSRQHIEISTPNKSILLVFKKQYSAKAIEKANLLRNDGASVCCIAFEETKSKEDYMTLASKQGISSVEFVEE